MEATGFENNGSRGSDVAKFGDKRAAFRRLCRTGSDPSQLPHAAAARPRDGAEAVGTMEGSRFYRDPVCTHILETPRLRGGRVRAGGSRERLLTPLQPTVIHFVSYQSNTINQAASWDVSGSRLLDNVPEIRRCLHDELRLRATFKSGSPPGARALPTRSRPSLMSTRMGSGRTTSARDAKAPRKVTAGKPSKN
jgi:hypothetical protein